MGGSPGGHLRGHDILEAFSVMGKGTDLSEN